jgi:hypothetical protein
MKIIWILFTVAYQIPEISARMLFAAIIKGQFPGRAAIKGIFN